jgi:hypothetical protein
VIPNSHSPNGICSCPRPTSLSISSAPHAANQNYQPTPA